MELAQYPDSKTIDHNPHRLSVPTSPVVSGAAPTRPNGDRMHSVSTVKSEATEKLLTPTITSLTDLERQTSRHHEGIYWKSPISMAAFFLLGIISSISHHFYYASLDGRQVGDDNAQQWALRLGLHFSCFP